jgi:hypothetical protein
MRPSISKPTGAGGLVDSGARMVAFIEEPRRGHKAAPTALGEIAVQC